MKKFQIACRTVTMAKWHCSAEDLETALQDVRELAKATGGVLMQPVDDKDKELNKIIVLYRDGRHAEYWVTPHIKGY